MTCFPTVKRFISQALLPVGQTMYVYGGGWNEQDTFAGTQARSIGIAPQWYNFFRTQSSDYNFKNFLHCSSLGLDCTGYIGWAIYNLFNEENGKDGYVFESRILGHKLSTMGLGSVTPSKNVTNHRCGDIFFSPRHRHAYISLGQCSDKSVLLLHSSPPGVMLSGTPAQSSCSPSIAQKYACFFMKKHHPEWFLKFPCSDRGIQYLHDYDRFRFYKVILPDPEGICAYSPQTILSKLSATL